MSDSKEFRIAMVDDEPFNLQMLDSILNPHYHISAFTSGEAALQHLDTIKPDLILMDIILPTISGFEVLEQLKNSNSLRSIPVIIITGLDSEADEERGFFLGAVDYITKPFKASIVKARVKTHLQIVQQFRTIERLGMVDAMTDIANRRCFDNQLNVEWGRSIREQAPISLLMMDVDKFKIYNDTYGHPQGDVLLKTIAKLFVTYCRRPSDLVARIGGEEFAVLLPNTSLEGAQRVAEEIRQGVESTIISSDFGDTSITISIGIAQALPGPETSLADFISSADTQLYTAKEGGRNRVCPYCEPLNRK